jgi:hypothetical protein
MVLLLFSGKTLVEFSGWLTLTGIAPLVLMQSLLGFVVKRNLRNYLFILDFPGVSDWLSLENNRAPAPVAGVADDQLAGNPLLTNIGVNLSQIALGWEVVLHLNLHLTFKVCHYSPILTY